jgi:hypothetical protein
MLLRIPLWILSKTLWLAVVLALTVVGIPAAIAVLVCGLCLALTAFALLLVPFVFLLFI